MNLVTVLAALNAKLESDGFLERFVLDTVPNGNKPYKALMLYNLEPSLSIELSQPFFENDWDLKYLGVYYDSLGYIDNLEKLIKLFYNNYVKPILKNELVALSYSYFEPGGCYVPKTIAFNFSEEQVKEMEKYRAISWTGEIKDKNVICYLISRRADVCAHRKSFIKEYCKANDIELDEKELDEY